MTVNCDFCRHKRKKENHNDDECSIMHKLRVNDRKLFSTIADEAQSYLGKWEGLKTAVRPTRSGTEQTRHDDESAKSRIILEQDKID
jgi:hypothetical protein